VKRILQRHGSPSETDATFSTLDVDAFLQQVYPTWYHNNKLHCPVTLKQRHPGRRSKNIRFILKPRKWQLPPKAATFTFQWTECEHLQFEDQETVTQKLSNLLPSAATGGKKKKRQVTQACFKLVAWILHEKYGLFPMSGNNIHCSGMMTMLLCFFPLFVLCSMLKQPYLAEGYEQANWKAIQSVLNANEITLDIMKVGRRPDPHQRDSPTSPDIVRYKHCFLREQVDSTPSKPLKDNFWLEPFTMLPGEFDLDALFVDLPIASTM